MLGSYEYLHAAVRGRVDLRKGNEINLVRSCLAVPIPAASVRAARAQRYGYNQRTALVVIVCVASLTLSAQNRSQGR